MTSYLYSVDITAHQYDLVKDVLVRNMDPASLSRLLRLSGRVTKEGAVTMTFISLTEAQLVFDLLKEEVSEFERPLGNSVLSALREAEKTVAGSRWIALRIVRNKLNESAGLRLSDE